MKTPFLQGDPRWRHDLVGDGPSSMHAVGCLVTCIAEVARFFGDDTVTPKIANTMLRDGCFFLRESCMLGTYNGEGLGFHMPLVARVTSSIDDLLRVRKLTRSIEDTLALDGSAILKVRHGQKNKTHFITLIAPATTDKRVPKWWCADPAAGKVSLRSDLTVSADWGRLLPEFYRVVEVRPCFKARPAAASSSAIVAK
jgi:hypothetical protein